jgi:hypothetical protein
MARSGQCSVEGGIRLAWYDLNNLGHVCTATEPDGGGRGKAYMRALGFRRQLARPIPTPILRDVAKTLNNLGILHSDQNRWRKGRKAF